MHDEDGSRSAVDPREWLAAVDVHRTALGPWGAVRPIVSIVWQGQRWVAVGRALLWGDWKLFPDFLIGYVPSVLGADWLSDEAQRREPELHPILSWYRQLRNPARSDAGRVAANAGGTAYLRLAYDLYLLEHHDSLSPRLLARLRDREQFQGARYELWAAATCIKAGCTVAFEDESDRSRKHFEFTAVHEGTGQRLCVEAKSKVRPGVKGDGRERSDPGGRPRVGQLLNQASRKPFTEPAIIFIDLNLPQSPDLSERDTTLRKLVQSVEQSAGESERWNLLVLTNHPDEWDEASRASGRPTAITVVARNPQRPVASVEVLPAIVHAAALSRSIPDTFDAMGRSRVGRL